MKTMYRLLLCFIFSVIVFSCKKDTPLSEDLLVPEISNMSRNSSSPAPGVAVVVSATIDSPESAPIYLVVLKWSVNGANPLSVSMRKDGSGLVYSATIPGQNVSGTIVEYTVSATNKNGTSEESGSYVVSDTPVEYFQLALNEINGNGEDPDKYIELYNNSSWAVPLHGITIYYNNFGSEAKLTWTGKDQVMKPKSFLLLKGTQGTGDLKRGLSATKGIIVEMKDTEGNTIDIFSIGEDAYRKNSYSRLPDGTGKWYVTFWSGTPGITNGINYGSQKIPSHPIMINFTRNVFAPAESDEVRVFSTVKAFSGTTLSSVVFKWTLGGIPQSEIAMTNEDDVFSATIPAHATGSVIVYTVTATNNENETVAVSSSYIVKKDGNIDYSKLKLNEVSGVGNDDAKFYELINTGTEDIPLADCKIYYNANSSTGGSFPPEDDRLSWTGNAMQVIKAGELFCLVGRNAPGSFTTGLTPERILIITLTDPAGNVLDQCIRAQDTGEYAGRDKSFSRIPDGTGPFYFTVPTQNAMNGSNAAGFLLVPVTQQGVQP